MNIRSVSSYVVHGKCFVVVQTEEGVEGVGECSPMHSETTARFVAEVLGPRIIGKNALETDKLWHVMMLDTYKLGVQGIQPEAVAGVDIALWDIRGKATGQPLCMMLGGCYREHIPMYASIGGGATMTPREMATRVEKAVHLGYKGVKIRMDWGVARQDRGPEKDLRMVEECKQVCGTTVPLSFDANNGYSVPTAIRQGRKFEALGLRHFEEPVAQFDYEGLGKVADALDLPVSAGEHEYTRWQFRDLILNARVDIVQPDVVKCAGITETMKIATLAEVFNRLFLPHQTQPSIGTAVNVHICAALHWCDLPQEYTGQSPELDELFEEPLVFYDGAITVPLRPGHGLVLKKSALDGATRFSTSAN